MAYGAIDPLAVVARYTTVDEVKTALNINDTSMDADVLQAIIAAELALDRITGRSLPDLPLVEPIHGDEIDGITGTRREWALTSSIGVLKLHDTVFGQGGADEWLGAIDVTEEARRALRRNPLGLDETVSFGVG